MTRFGAKCVLETMSVKINTLFSTEYRSLQVMAVLDITVHCITYHLQIIDIRIMHYISQIATLPLIVNRYTYSLVYF